MLPKYQALVGATCTLYHVFGIQMNSKSYRGKTHFWFKPEIERGNIISQ